jgi:hypothetical protein
MRVRSWFGVVVLSACAAKPSVQSGAGSRRCMEDGTPVSAEGTGAEAAWAKALLAVGKIRYTARVAWDCEPAGCKLPADENLTLVLESAKEVCSVYDCSAQPDAVGALPLAERAKACPRALALEATVSVQSDAGLLQQTFSGRWLSTQAGSARFEAVNANEPSLLAKLGADPAYRAQISLRLSATMPGPQAGTLRIAIENPAPEGAENMARGVWTGSFRQR